jgi:hypothetical protein
MTPDAPTMVLRLSVPADGELPTVAADVAVKIAEHLGRSPAEAKAATDTIQALMADVAPNGRGGDDITFEFHRVDDQLRIEARCAGRTAQARHPLPT